MPPESENTKVVPMNDVVPADQVPTSPTSNPTIVTNTPVTSDPMFAKDPQPMNVTTPPVQEPKVTSELPAAPAPAQPVVKPETVITPQIEVPKEPIVSVSAQVAPITNYVKRKNNRKMSTARRVFILVGTAVVLLVLVGLALVLIN